MRYVGGKFRISSWVREQIEPLIDGHTHYLEPFVGGGATFFKNSARFESVTAADSHEDLILMWQAVASGWDPPTSVGPDEYARLRDAAPSALRGFVGFGASWGGKWFGGYVDSCWDVHHGRMTRPYLSAARNSVLTMAPAFRRAAVVLADYADHAAHAGQFIYCDPPYCGTIGYRGSHGFDSAEFWDVAGTWADAGATVVVSESSAPAGWRVLSVRERKAMLRVVRGAAGEVSETRREFLYVRDL